MRFLRIYILARPAYRNSRQGRLPSSRPIPQVLDNILEFLSSAPEPRSVREIAVASGLEEGEARLMVSILADKLGLVTLEGDVVRLGPDVLSVLVGDEA